MTSPYPSTTLVVVDSTVKDYQGLIDSVSCDTKVVVLNAYQDGIEQITSVLRNYREISSLHILSHGESGTLHLGNARLSLATLEHYAEQLQTWSKAIAANASIFLYGCRVASGTLGRNFVQRLSQLTNTSIAASKNLTGNAALGGDWTLEFATGVINAPLAFSSEAIAAYPHVLQQVLLTETFTGEDVLENTWLFGVENPEQGQADPFLTARGTVEPSTGGLPGNPGVTPYPAVDTSGSGVLRLTNATTDQASYVLYNRPISSSAGLFITFDFFSYGGTGADGFSFFLADGANPPTVAGGFGGSLGYAQIDADFQGDGVAGGYLGIGFDEYGNYSNPTESRVGGIGFTPDAVAIRGSEANDYAYLTGTETLPYSLDVPDAANREAARRTAQIELTPEGLLSVRIDVDGDGLFTGEGESPEELQNFNVVEANGELPDLFTFGFASGTGIFTNVHEIRNLEVLTFTDPPEVSDVTNNIPAGTTTNLTGLSATDPDGDVVSYTIETLPDATQGILYLGDPTAGGTAVTAGQELTPEQITQLFFQPTAGFTEATFTYNATDELGGQDATPGTVTLALLDIGNQPPVADDLIIDELNPDSTILIPPLVATDPDGSIESFTIVTLPESSQGVLYLGNPAAGGTPIEAGTVLTPDQVDELYLQINPNFTEGTFTFYATDNQGAVSNVATVTLDDATIIDPVNPGGPGDQGCEPGIRRRGNDNDNNLRGTSGIDTLLGGGGNDTLNGLGCPDLLEGNGGRDEIFGGNGSDTIRGGLGNDVLSGQNGIDIINGGLGDDTINGGDGDDRIQGRRGDDVINGRTGNDFIVGNDGNDVLAGGANHDVIRGLDGDDRVNGNTGNDSLSGGNGDDLILGGSGNDFIFGGNGNDRLRGHEGVDVIRGALGRDLLHGGSQADQLYGQGGADTLIGGGGLDTLSGGAGADTFVFRDIDHSGDVIIDFRVNDLLDFSAIFTNPGYTRTGTFAYIRRVQSEGDTVIRVDSNGNQSGGFIDYVTLLNTAAADVTARNFIV